MHPAWLLKRIVGSCCRAHPLEKWPEESQMFASCSRPEAVNHMIDMGQFYGYGNPNAMIHTFHNLYNLFFGFTNILQHVLKEPLKDEGQCGTSLVAIPPSSRFQFKFQLGSVFTHILRS